MISKSLPVALVIATFIARCGTSPACDPPKRMLGNPRSYGGTVTAVGKDWVELGIGWRGSQTIDSQGFDISPKYDTSKPKRIGTPGTIPGGAKDGAGRRETYRLADLKLGDKVQIATGEDDQGVWTQEIRILRRPGGKVPPNPGDEFATENEGSHMRMRAYQDWEEKGIPIPKNYLGADGRCNTDPPYPPVAPPPRPILKESRTSE